MAILTTTELEYVIRGYHECKSVWSPEINERLSNSRTTSSLESRTSRVLNLSKEFQSDLRKIFMSPKGAHVRAGKIRGAFIGESPN